MNSSSITSLRHCARSSQYARLAASRISKAPASSVLLHRLRPSQVRYTTNDSHGDGKVSQSVKTPESPRLNPPASTRPPPLTLPIQATFDSRFKYFFALAKTYLVFFKDGFKNVLANRRLLNERLQSLPRDDRPSLSNPTVVPRSFSRADWVLLWRNRHDTIRLPAFGLLIMVTGEFSPFIVPLFPGFVPLPCRPPILLSRNLEQAEARRKTVFDQLEAKAPEGVLSPSVTKGVARKHVLRSLYLSGSPWETLSFLPPGMWFMKGQWRMAFLEGDDQKIIEEGGLTGLVKEELRSACVERGIDVLGKSDSDMRALLGDWLRLTAAEDIAERRKRMAVLLLTRQKNWPRTRDFALPEWHL